MKGLGKNLIQLSGKRIAQARSLYLAFFSFCSPARFPVRAHWYSCPSYLQCCELAAKLAGDLEYEGIKGKTLTLKLKPPTFEVSLVHACKSSIASDEGGRFKSE